MISLIFAVVSLSALKVTFSATDLMGLSGFRLGEVKGSVHPRSLRLYFFPKCSPHHI